MKNHELIDISLSLSEKTIIYPNNPSIEIKTFKNPGGWSYLSRIAFGSHTGTHIDGPAHVLAGGINIDELPLDLMIGPCRVLDMTTSKKSVTQEELVKKRIKKGERILLKTKNSSRGYERFYSDYIFVASEAARYLSQRQIKLIGIDYLSIKQKGVKDNTPHTAFLAKKIPILEGINLVNVNEGAYFLIALPLKFVGIEAAPARAVLLKN